MSLPDSIGKCKVIMLVCLLLLQNGLNGEEGLSEEEKARRRAERRRAKRKVGHILTSKKKNLCLRDR